MEFQKLLPHSELKVSTGSEGSMLPANAPATEATREKIATDASVANMSLL